MKPRDFHTTNNFVRIVNSRELRHTWRVHGYNNKWTQKTVNLTTGKNNLKTYYLYETGCDDGGWIELAQDGV